MYNGASASVPAAALWVDDIRLGGAVDNTGLVRHLSVDVRASDVMGLSFSMSGTNPYFRQLGQVPTFIATRDYRFGGSLQFGRFLPTAWGVQLPITLSYSNSSSEPLLLPRSDIRADQLRGLRTPSGRNLRVALNLSRRAQRRSSGMSWLLDNSALRFSYDRRNTKNTRTSTEADGIATGYSYRSDVGDVSLPLFPGPLDKIFFFLPRAVRGSRLRLTPLSLQLASSYVNAETQTERFAEIIELPGDSAVVPITRLDQRLQGNLSANLAPFSSLTGRLGLAQDRDLVPTRALVQGGEARQAINEERVHIGGLDLGWLTGQSITSNLTFRPGITTWLTPQASLDTRYQSNRSASYITDLDGDTVLTNDFANSRDLRASMGFSTPGFFRSMFGLEETGLLGAFLALTDHIDIFTATWVGGLRSDYSRQTAKADLAYKLGLGGFDEFGVQDGDTASRVVESQTLNLSSGLRLPFGVGFNVDFTQTNGETFTPITETLIHSTGWPSLGLTWNRLPIPAPLQRWVQSLGLRTGYRLRSTRNQVVDANQDRESELKTIPLTVNLVLTTGWSLSYNLTLTDEQRIDPTGVTLSDRANHSFQLNGRIQALSETGTFRSPIRTSLRLTQSVREDCRLLGAVTSDPTDGTEPLVPGATCEPFTDLRIRTIDLTVDTDFTPFIVGLQGSWRDTQSGIGQRIGSTQFEITMFGQFIFESGTVR